VSFVGQWNEIERRLADDWGDARLVITVPDDGNCDRAAALMGPANPGRSGKSIRFFAARRGEGGGVSPDLVRRLLRRLDDARITGTLELTGSDAAIAAPEIARRTLADEWDAATAAFPDDWSDVYAELELRSARDLDRAALAISPLNPAAFGGRPGYRFRIARTFGYGASPEVARRCFERVDELGVRGELHVLRVLSDTKPVATQGPVWRVGGKAV
jgi:hypothetical protein